MAIVVETGAGLTNSNSYVTEAEVTAYASDRGVTLTETVSVLIYKAMDYLQTLDYIGTKYSEEQALLWPRDGVYIDGYYIERSTIPQELKNGQMLLCMSIDAGVDPMTSLTRATKKEKLDTLEVEYMDNAATRTLITSVDNTLKKLLASGNNGLSFNVFRA